ncbi:MAG: tellurite resistance TerB family protein [Proteobacteria bacterium]|nr:tellurite resistance TerB family protein [Pseudomonadota bacterium]
MSNQHPAISHHAALIYTMVMAAAVDRDMKDIELGQIGRLVKSLPAFLGYDVGQLTDTAKECAVILSTNDGLNRILAMIAEALPHQLRETAYLLACEIAAIDRRVSFEEIQLLHMIRKALHVDPLAAAAVERATVARLAAT